MNHEIEEAVLTAQERREDEEHEQLRSSVKAEQLLSAARQSSAPGAVAGVAVGKKVP